MRFRTFMRSRTQADQGGLRDNLTRLQFPWLVIVEAFVECGSQRQIEMSGSCGPGGPWAS